MVVGGEFRALARKDAGSISAEPRTSFVSGNQILVPVEIRRPETVDYVGRRHLDEHRPTDGHMDLVSRLHNILRVASVRVLDLPPPLMADDIDAQRPPAADSTE